eukprot:COSAG06_NODE_32126_length_510_cov_290.433090_1_plen_47_part_10
MAARSLSGLQQRQGRGKTKHGVGSCLNALRPECDGACRSTAAAAGSG